MRHLGKEGMWVEPALGLHGRNGGDDLEPRRRVELTPVIKSAHSSVAAASSITSMSEEDESSENE